MSEALRPLNESDPLGHPDLQFDVAVDDRAVEWGESVFLPIQQIDFASTRQEFRSENYVIGMRCRRITKLTCC